MTDKNNEIKVINESKEMAVEAQQPTTIADAIIELAKDPNLDIAKLDALNEMRKDERDSQARRDFFAAISRFRGIMPEIKKDATVDFTSQKGRTNYSYATLGAIEKQIKEPLAACGLAYFFTQDQNDNGMMKITCILAHENGHQVESSMVGAPDATGNKNPIQQLASTSTYLKKYTLLAVTGLATADHDDDGHGAGDAPEIELINDDQITVLNDLIKETGANKQAFLKVCKVESFADLPASKYQSAKERLESKKK